MKRIPRLFASLSLITALVAVIYGTSSISAIASTGHVGRVAQSYGTPMPTTGTTMGTTGTTSSTTTGIAYSAARPAPVVPAGSAVVSQSTAAGGTLVVYRSGSLYYNVTYSPTGRYTYTVTRVPGATVVSTTVAPSTTSSTVSTLPTTGGADPSAPILPLLLGLVLTALGLTTRRLTHSVQ